MSVNSILDVLEKLQEVDWESCQLVQRHIRVRLKEISADPSWRRVQLISLLLDDLSELVLTDMKDPLILSVSQRKILSQAFDFLVGYAIRPNLLPAIWRSTRKVPATEPRRALEEHRRLVGSVNLLLHFASIPQFGPLLYEAHLSDLLVAMFQLCHAPVRKVEGSNIDFAKQRNKGEYQSDVLVWLAHGLEISSRDETITVESVVAEMQSDRLDLLPKADSLVSTLFQPAVIKCLMEMLSHKNPAWLRKACAGKLSNALLVKHGLAHLLVAVSDSFGSDVAEWRQVDNFASLVARHPSFMDQAVYLKNMGEQLHSIMFICKDPTQFRLIVAVLNALLAGSPTLAVDPVFYCCFKVVVDILRGRGAISSEMLSQHFTFVSDALDVLPQDAVLLEAFAILMPVYLRVAVFGHGSASGMAKQAMEIVAELTDKIEEGPSLLIGVLDPAEMRFPMHPTVKASFADDGGVQLSTEDQANVQDRAQQLNVDTHVDFFITLGKVQPRLLPRLFLALLRKFDQFEENVSTEEGIYFRVFVAALITALNPLVQDPLQRDTELMTEFALANLQRYFSASSAANNDDSLGLTLGMLETLASNSDQISSIGLSRLKLASELLRDVSGHLAERCADLSKVIGELELIQDVKAYSSSATFVSWKFAPAATKALLNLDWNQAESSAVNEELVDWKEPTLDELVTYRIQRNRVMVKASIYGTTSDYRRVKEQLENPDTATRGHGYIQLRKLLSARDSDTVKNIDTVVELCRQGMEDTDSYIYLGAVQCFALLVELDTARQLPTLMDVLSDASSSKDNRVKVLLAECLARYIPAFGDMMPTYSERLIEVLLTCCRAEEDLMRVFGCSLLGEVVGRLTNVERIFRQTINIIVALMTSDQCDMVRWAAAEGLASLMKGMDAAILASDYGGEVRDLHRVVKHLYANTEDQRLMGHLQEVLLSLGDLAKKLIQGNGLDPGDDSQMRKLKL